ncbi:adenosylmethionine-8-amino-7-oxononanoate aminotransferase [Intrasporangium oryzae NRRL B-24470]|uniref:Adenosylmethionine-8-amino-7-oxononanoate aminotransferase n=1 Tax=Intrasporangium oryzae NRRL B-24470 TaxID=1386089 RepID=W9G604_9MICO|nr:adenosylmethionine--8-amino-7-oxononanoate transaminase [Intrasporangium oryzae]EWT00742.1 adenosylmethionine-8-amino-7-oxononanoate aminotransferase [Intrasporangium oryzae NRRL B-24470]
MPERAAGVGLADRDRGLVWHPYAPLDGPEPYAVSAASGVRLTLTDRAGTTTEVIDAMASWWCAIHGYRHPVLDAAAHAQVDRFSHVMFGGLTHEPAVALAERLTAIAPGPMAHVFFADSGSVSVEVALKLTLQYQAAVGRPGRQRFLTVRGGYHGDTFAAMSVCDPVDGMHSAFPGALARHVFAPRPPAARLVVGGDGAERWETDESALAEWETTFRELAAAHADEIAGIIVEPVLQGAGGMYVYHPDCLRTMRSVADELGLLLVADEIATGFGRTGRLFASEWADAAPDVLCVGKALTGGYLTLAAVLTTLAVGAAVTRSEFRALLHGPTFMANPLACAVAGASLDLLETRWKDDVARVGAALATGLAPAREHPAVRDVRSLGAVFVVQLHGPVDVPAVTRAAVRRGVWVRPFRDLVYTMPPYVSSDEDVATIAAAVIGAVDEVHGS